MRTIRIVLLLCLGGCLTTGCTTTLKNQGEVGFRYGTEFTFFHRAAQTSPEPAVSKTEVPALTEWLFRRPDDEIVGPPSPDAVP